MQLNLYLRVFQVVDFEKRDNLSIYLFVYQPFALKKFLLFEGL